MLYTVLQVLVIAAALVFSLQHVARKLFPRTFGQLAQAILPQALKIAIPPTVGFSVQVIKGTALTSIIGFVELSKAGTIVTNATFQPFTVYGLVALIYFALCWPLSKSSQILERKLNVAHRNH